MFIHHEGRTRVEQNATGTMREKSNAKIQPYDSSECSHRFSTIYVSDIYILIFPIVCLCALTLYPARADCAAATDISDGAFSCAGACRRPEGVVFIVSRLLAAACRRLQAPAGGYGSSLLCRQDGSAHRF